MSTNEEPIFSVRNNHNPLPFEVVVLKDNSLEQYVITLTISGMKFSRMEKARIKAVEVAKNISYSIEHAFMYMWEDRT